MSKTLPYIAWGLIPVLVLVTSPTRADVVPPLPDECPPGSGVDYGCGSAFCSAFVCETDADCKGGDCEPVKACFGPNDGLLPPPTEHGGPCLRDETCNDEKLTCQTLGLCLSFGSGTSGEETTATASSTGASSVGGATTGVAATGGSSGISTGVGATGSAPTGGDVSTSTGGATGGGGSSGTSGGSGGGGGCSCSLADGSSGLLGLFGLVALWRRRWRRIA